MEGHLWLNSIKDIGYFFFHRVYIHICIQRYKAVYIYIDMYIDIYIYIYILLGRPGFGSVTFMKSRSW